MIGSMIAALSTLLIPAFALAAVPTVQPELPLALPERTPLETSPKTLALNDSPTNGQNSAAGMNALVVKFSKYDFVFWDVIDNAAHGGSDGYRFKYKIYF